MALHRKFEALTSLEPDIAVVCECAELREMIVGTYEEWCGSGRSDHVPLVVDVDL